MIDRQTIERIKDTADIVDVVSDFVSLKKVGVNYRGLCPFHNDHTPSFYVSPTRRTCHCFVCGEGGDSVGFIMRHEQLTYPDALRWLANRYHIEIKEKEQTDEERKAQSERESMYILNEWAAGYFSDVMHNDADGRATGLQYFRQRGIRDDIIEKFRLGFCLNNRTALSNAALQKGYQSEYLLKTGLCYSKDDGKLIDRFAGRAMFPWIGISGKVVAFGGRVLDARTKGVMQKYVNSPDSDIYHKDHELYGIFQAKKAIAKENLVYMVEGYTDVISMHQCGIENVVANSGTALSEHQIHILHRFTPNIVLLYDGDAAGIKAALRGTDMLLKEGMNVKVMLLPDGDDPDSFARKHSAEEFRTYIKEHQSDFIAFKSKVLLDGVTDPHERSAAITSIIHSVSVISDPIVRAAYMQDCAARLGFNEQTLTAKLNEEIRNNREEMRKEEMRRERTRVQQPADATTPTADNVEDRQTVQQQSQQQLQQQLQQQRSAQQSAQPPVVSAATTSSAVSDKRAHNALTVADMIMKVVVQHGGDTLYEDVETDEGGTTSLTVAQFISYDLSQDSLAFGNEMHNRILAEATAQSENGNFDAESYFTLHPDYDISSYAITLTATDGLVSESMKREPSIEQRRDKVNHLLLDFRNEYINHRLLTVRNEMNAAAGDAVRMQELMREMQQVQEIRKAIARKIGGSIMSFHNKQ